VTTALVLSGGGSLGAVQVGMLRALIEAEVEFDMVVGTSVGAVNATWIAADPSPRGVEGLTRLWCELRRDDVFPTSPWHGVLAASGLRRSLVPDRGLRALLNRHLGFERLEDAPTAVHVVAVDALTGRSTALSTGPAVEAVLASTAIPGILPPVRIGSRWFLDGAVVDNCPIRHAVDLGADTLWVLPAGYPCASAELPSTAVGMALQGLTLLVQHGLAVDLDRYRRDVEVRVAPPLCPLAVSPSDFSHSAELIARARATTTAWVSAGCPVDRQAFSPTHLHESPPGPRLVRDGSTESG
jgi:NTE family protein